MHLCLALQVLRDGWQEPRQHRPEREAAHIGGSVGDVLTIEIDVAFGVHVALLDRRLHFELRTVASQIELRIQVRNFLAADRQFGGLDAAGQLRVLKCSVTSERCSNDAGQTTCALLKDLNTIEL